MASGAAGLGRQRAQLVSGRHAADRRFQAPHRGAKSGPRPLAGRIRRPLSGGGRAAAAQIQESRRADPVGARRPRRRRFTAAIPELVADFLALGYAKLQLELLCRHMHYVSNIDEVFFNQHAVAGATAAMAGDDETARDHLARAFEGLFEARKHFYPVDVLLLDLTLVADTTLGESLRRELAQDAPINLLISGALCESIAREQPQTLSALRQALHQPHRRASRRRAARSRTTAVAAGDGEAIDHRRAAQLSAIGWRAPDVYGRRRFGLTPVLPQLLLKLGFQGAVHCTLDDGQFPLAQQCKTRWEGIDSSILDAYAHLPLDANAPGCFLDLGRRLGRSMETDHVATLMFAHWPSTASEWYGDLRRIARYSPVLGKFLRADEYFSQTAQPMIYSRFSADQYRSPYLLQGVIRRQGDPVTRYVREHQSESARYAAGALQLMTTAIGAASACAKADPAASPAHGAFAAAYQGADAPRSFDLSSALSGFAAALPRQSAAPVRGLLLVNPLSFGRRTGIEWPVAAGLPAIAAPVRSVAVYGDTAAAIVDVPAMGFARIELSSSTPPAAKKRDKPIASDNMLSNEAMSVTISANTGGIQSIHDFDQRGNRLSQRLALRTPGESPGVGQPWRDPDELAVYTAMVCDTLTITVNSPTLGEIVTSGGLIDAEGKRLATYRQRVRLWQGSRILWLTIDLEPGEALRSDPWNSYLAARFAWHDSTATLYRGVQQMRQPSTARRIEAPEYVEIEDGAGTTTLLTGGHPYHRRVGDRTLDTLLIVRGETARQFNLGIGVDLAHPHTAALELLSPPLVLSEPDRAPAANPTGWLFHLDSRHVVATHWEPIYTGPDDPSGPTGKTIAPATAAAHGAPRGFRVRLLDASGRGGSVTLRTPQRGGGPPIQFSRRSLGRPLGHRG